LKKKITVIIGGGIAAYKSLELIRFLQSENFEIIPVLTKSASNFITSLSISAISKNKVYSDLFDLNDETEMGHIQLSRVSELLVVAPATANLISKFANGIADDLATTLVLATDKKVLLAPSMNVRMWNHPATKENIIKLKQFGFELIGPNSGEMACGEFGLGRMAEPIEIKNQILSSLKNKNLSNKKILITSGATIERIDPVRYISNDSSGIQGTSIANALIRKGAEVIFVTGKSTYEKPLGAKIINVESAREMYDAVFKNGPYNVAICAAAVSDWYVDNKNSKKIKKSFLKSPQISLKENPDILSDISKSKNRPELVIGFAAETDDLIKNAKSKLNQKGCDIIVANKIDNKSSVFGNLENKVSIISNDKTVHWPKMSKAEIGEKLSDLIENH
jgi:phosphopantothenoylcysteine decarboxylase/phosphopantothenate--cysteine ligase|tara:strand:+ start:1057 stop:2235 length:1179 start_codon:yes stop_codon:yes gene_type:complete